MLHSGISHCPVYLWLPVSAASVLNPVEPSGTGRGRQGMAAATAAQTSPAPVFCTALQNRLALWGHTMLFAGPGRGMRYQDTVCVCVCASARSIKGESVVQVYTGIDT